MRRKGGREEKEGLCVLRAVPHSRGGPHPPTMVCRRAAAAIDAGNRQWIAAWRPAHHRQVVEKLVGALEGQIESDNERQLRARRRRRRRRAGQWHFSSQSLCTAASHWGSVLHASVALARSVVGLAKSRCLVERRRPPGPPGPEYVESKSSTHAEDSPGCAIPCPSLCLPGAAAGGARRGCRARRLLVLAGAGSGPPRLARFCPFCSVGVLSQLLI